MKKTLILLVALLSVVCAITLFACGGDDGSDSSFPTYKITLEKSSDYELSASTLTSESYKEIIITVTLKNADKKLVGIKYGDEYAYRLSDTTYRLLMPAKNVTVSAELEDYAEILKSDNTSTPFVSFSSANAKTVVPNTGYAYLNLNFNANWMTILNKEVKSANKSVVPIEAIAIVTEEASSSNAIVGAKIRIDTSKVSKGSSWITFNFTNGNSSSQKGTIVFKLTVADSIEVETWTETVVFDTSALPAEYSGKTFDVSFTDYNFVSGMTNKEYQKFAQAAVDNKVSVDIEYAVGHKYFVSFGIVDETNPSNTIWFTLNETVGSGSTATGFNQYRNSYLSFIQNGYTLTIKVIKS